MALDKVDRITTLGCKVLCEDNRHLNIRFTTVCVSIDRLLQNLCSASFLSHSEEPLKMNLLPLPPNEHEIDRLIEFTRHYILEAERRGTPVKTGRNEHAVRITKL